MACNTSVQPTTGYTPFYLMFGRQVRMPVDLMQDRIGSKPTYVWCSTLTLPAPRNATVSLQILEI